MRVTHARSALRARTDHYSSVLHGPIMLYMYEVGFDLFQPFTPKTSLSGGHRKHTVSPPFSYSSDSSGATTRK